MKLAPNAHSLAKLALELQAALAEYTPAEDFSIEVSRGAVDLYKDGLGVAGSFGAVPVALLAQEIQDLSEERASRGCNA